jgi:hypothetical protein
MWETLGHEIWRLIALELSTKDTMQLMLCAKWLHTVKETLTPSCIYTETTIRIDSKDKAHIVWRSRAVRNNNDNDNNSDDGDDHRNRSITIRDYRDTNALRITLNRRTAFIERHDRFQVRYKTADVEFVLQWFKTDAIKFFSIGIQRSGNSRTKLSFSSDLCSYYKYCNIYASGKEKLTYDCMENVMLDAQGLDRFLATLGFGWNFANMVRNAPREIKKIADMSQRTERFKKLVDLDGNKNGDGDVGRELKASLLAIDSGWRCPTF